MARSRPSGVRSARHDLGLLGTGYWWETLGYIIYHGSGLGFDKFRVPLMTTDKAN